MVTLEMEDWLADSLADVLEDITFKNDSDWVDLAALLRQGGRDGNATVTRGERE